MRLRHLITLGAVGSGFVLASAASAPAATYCVHVAGSCAAGAIDAGADLQAGITMAQAANGPDVLTIGPGTYTAPLNGFVVNGADALQIVGSGDATVLDGTTSPIIALGGHDLSSVAVQVPATPATTGVTSLVSGTIDHVTITGGAGNSQGINAGGGVTVRDSAITMSGIAIGVMVSDVNGASPTVRDTSITAYYGVSAFGITAGPTVRMTGLDIHASIALNAFHAAVVFDNSIVHHLGGQAAIMSQCGAQGSASVTADHLTILGDGVSTALYAWCGVNGFVGDLAMTNSTVRDFSHLSDRTGTAGGSATIALAYSDAVPSALADSGAGAVTFGAGMIAPAVPGFVSLADPHLTATSPLVDAGAPGAAAQATDKDGLTRVSGSRQDIGALELQQPDPPAPAKPKPAVPVDAGADPAAAPQASLPPAPAPAGPAPLAPATPDALRAALRDAIRSGHGTTLLALRWLAPGTARFTWRVGHRVVGSVTVRRRTLAAPATGALRVHLRRRLAAGQRVSVRATFTTVGGEVVSARGSFSRSVR
jgi:hypothetical protein